MTRDRRTVAARPLPTSDARPTVGVVIPCYNYARFLPLAVQSAVSQTGVDVSIVIVDDASTDDSPAVADALARQHPSVTALHHARNSGPVETFNDGLAAVRGEFLVRLDADDLLTPGSLARSVAVARAFPDVGLVYGHPLHFDRMPLPTPRITARQWTVWPGRTWLRDRCADGLNVITSPEVLMRRSVVDRVGGQMPLPHTHDMEMWLRIAAFSDVAYIRGADQAWHRDHPASLSATQVNPLRDLLERAAAFDTLFSGPVASIPDASALRGTVRRRLVTDALDAACREYDHTVVDEEAVTGYVEFARLTCTTVTSLPQWRELERRASLRDGAASRTPRVLTRRVARRIRSDISWRRWHRTGVF